MILIIFGLPGSGKNYIAKIISNNFGYYLYDADLDLLKETKTIIKKGELVSEAKRRKIYSKLATRVGCLEKKYGHVVMPRTFSLEKTRRFFKKHLPQCIFIYVKASIIIRHKRIKKRHHHINFDYAKKFDRLFEKPNINHFIINNSKNGKRHILKQVTNLIQNIISK